MTIRVAINGLGRIGRCIVRAIFENNYKNIELVAVNGPADIDTHIHLLNYDSVHGYFGKAKKGKNNEIIIDSKKIKLFQERDPARLPWGELNIDVVLECTGIFKDKNEAMKHLEAGAKKVIISAPAKNVDAVIVYGVNHENLKSSHQVISIGSCTTNCLAPIAKILNDIIGIESGYMTTIHAYTNDQNIMDNSHKDLRRARAACMSMIPTSTGAAKALSEVIPELAGKLDGSAIRVPTPNVSCVDLSFLASKNTDIEEINNIISKAAKDPLMNKVVGLNNLELVSIDFNHNSHSSIFDLTATKVVNNRFVRILSWYDNEWGFSCRMLDVALLFEELN